MKGASMITIKTGETQLSISIDSYQYKYLESKPGEFDYDANWLNIAVTYTDAGKDQLSVDPCLLTTELNQVTAEFERIVEGEEISYISDFLEPYLTIAFSRDKNRIAVIIHYVFDTTDGIWKTWKVTQSLSMGEAYAMLDELKRMTEMYPER